MNEELKSQKVTSPGEACPLNALVVWRGFYHKFKFYINFCAIFIGILEFKLKTF